MIERLMNRAQFQLEKFILRGSLYRLLFIALVIGLISFVAGLIAFFFASGFNSPGEAVWWAFLRLTDPGYLGDDEGTLLRTVSTIVTVLGYVFFMGALIAIMTQGLNETIARLQRGLAPIAQKHHFLMLGWTNRTAAIVEELIRSEERMERFLRLRGARKLRVVILAEEDPVLLVNELKEHLGSLWSAGQVTFRHGSALRSEHLERVDFLNAGAILLPAGESVSERAMTADGRTIKTILATSRSCAEKSGGEAPLLVAEILDRTKVPLAEGAYRGPIEVLSSDLLVSRLVAQTVRHAGLSHVFDELLTQDEGNELYLPQVPQLAGVRFAEAVDRFPGAVPLGVLGIAGGHSDPRLVPPPGYLIGENDQLLVMAENFSRARITAPPAEGGQHTHTGDRAAPRLSPADDTPRRVLILGWNHKAPALIREFDRYAGGGHQLDIVSLLPAAEREAQVARRSVAPENVAVRQIVADSTSSADMKRIRPGDYTNVVLLASGRLESEQESDARTILSYLLLQEALAAGDQRPRILVELMESGNADVFRNRGDEVLTSPLVLSHMMAQVALRRELRVVFDELFGAGGAEIIFRGTSRYGLAGREVRFHDVQRVVAGRGEIALGLRFATQRSGPRGGVALNPDREKTFTLTEDDRVVALTRYEVVAAETLAR